MADANANNMIMVKTNYVSGDTLGLDAGSKLVYDGVKKAIAGNAAFPAIAKDIKPYSNKRWY